MIQTECNNYERFTSMKNKLLILSIPAIALIGLGSAGIASANTVQFAPQSIQCLAAPSDTTICYGFNKQSFSIANQSQLSPGIYTFLSAKTSKNILGSNKLNPTFKYDSSGIIQSKTLILKSPVQAKAEIKSHGWKKVGGHYKCSGSAGFCPFSS